MASSDNQFVIVGGGIGGLATALALHRKGFHDVAVYERSDTLRAEGTAIGVCPNGWRALEQLGVGAQLRDKAILLHGGEDLRFSDQRIHSLKTQHSNGEFRCLQRKDLVEALLNALPPKTVKFGCNVVAVKMDPQTLSPVLQLDDDNIVRAQVLIGCDGSHSKVANFLGLKPASLYSLGAVRGLANYPNGHSFSPIFLRRRDTKSGRLVGRVPITDKLVYWFLAAPLSQLEGIVTDDPEVIKQATLGLIKGFPADTLEMVEKSDLNSLSFTRLRYRHPWEILRSKFHKGPVTVVGDAMHVMGPFLGQGGSAAMEDGVVLARNLSQQIISKDGNVVLSRVKIEEALGGYVSERRMRIARLSAQAYLVGLLIGATPSVVKFFAVVFMIIFYRDPTGHSKYDCGNL